VNWHTEVGRTFDRNVGAKKTLSGARWSRAEVRLSAGVELRLLRSHGGGLLRAAEFEICYCE